MTNNNDTTPSPLIWIGCLASHNNGEPHGTWLRADRPHDELLQDLQIILDTSPAPGAEEFAIFDYMHFGHYSVDTYDSLRRVTAIASGITNDDCQAIVFDS